MYREHSNQLTGLIFILLLVGHEAVRTNEAIEAFSEPMQHKAMKQRAAAARERDRQINGLRPESLMAEVAARDVGWRRASGAGSEVARGMLAWHKYSKKDPKCFYPKGCYVPVFAQLVQHESRAGAAYLKLYKDLDEEAFMQGSPIPAEKLYHTFEMRDDSLVGVEKSLGLEQIPGLKIRARKDSEDNPSYTYLRMIPGKGWIKLAPQSGDESEGQAPLEFKAEPMQLASTWLGVIKTLQAVGTGITNGQTLIQCSYIPETDSCTSPEFCTLEKGESKSKLEFWKKSSDGHCSPKVGPAENQEAWRNFVQRAQKDAQEIEERACFAGCRGKWKQSIEDAAFAKSLASKVPTDTRTLGDMGELANEIKASAVSEKIVGHLSAAFDTNRKQTLSPLWAIMKKESCTNVEDGSIAAVFKYSLKLGEDAEADAADFNKYVEQCPWFAKLAGTSPDDAMTQLAQQDKAVNAAAASDRMKGMKDKIESDVIADAGSHPDLSFDVSSGVASLKDLSKDGDGASLLETDMSGIVVTFLIVVVVIIVLSLFVMMFSQCGSLAFQLGFVVFSFGAMLLLTAGLIYVAVLAGSMAGVILATIFPVNLFRIVAENGLLGTGADATCERVKGKQGKSPNYSTEQYKNQRYN